MRNTHQVNILSLFIAGCLLLLGASIHADCGDVNNDGRINVSDQTYLVDHFYRQGPPPVCSETYVGTCGDVDYSGTLNNSDLLYLIAYIFQGGPAPYCGPERGTVTDIDGNVYETVKLGDQWWMAENLRVTRYRNGDTISNIIDSTAWESTTSGARCAYYNDEDSLEFYGRLYNWYAVDDSRGLAPQGWHVATDAEWQELEMFLGMSAEDAAFEGSDRGTDQGDQMKDTVGWNWGVPDSVLTNLMGFSVRPGGHRDKSGSFGFTGVWIRYWTATSDWATVAWHREIYIGPDIPRANWDFGFGYAVRCVKD